MTVHPPAPTDLAGLIEAYAATSAAVLALGEDLGPGQEALPTECPGWSVLDQIRHVASIESMLLGEPVPEIDVSGMPHVRNDFGVVIEKYLERRRDRDVADVVAELRSVRERRLADLSVPGLTVDSETVGPFGTTKVGGMLALRTFDIWTHEQDLREALGRPGGLDAPGASVAVTRIGRALRHVLTAEHGLRTGDRVRFLVEGPVTADLEVVVDRDGSAGSEGSEGSESSEGSAPAAREVTIRLSTRAFTRRGAGRWAVEALGAEVDGDAELAQAALTAMAVTP